MSRIITCICFAALVCAGSLQALGDDVREKLDKATAEYEESLKKHKDRVKEYFKTREEFYRNQGKKKEVDQIKQDRKKFEATGELPSTAPATLRVGPLSALRILTTSYRNAVTEYTQKNQDDLADAIEKELAEIKAKAGFPSIAGVWQEGPEDTHIQVTIKQMGQKFTATCTYQHKVHGEIRWRMEGTISKEGDINGDLEHTQAPPSFLKQTRTAKYSATDGMILGNAVWAGGKHDFEWKLISSEN
jgi:hypothetical protein